MLTELQRDDMRRVIRSMPKPRFTVRVVELATLDLPDFRLDTDVSVS